MEAQEEEGQQRGPPAQEKPRPVAEQDLGTHIGHHFRGSLLITGAALVPNRPLRRRRSTADSWFPMVLASPSDFRERNEVANFPLK